MSDIMLTPRCFKWIVLRVWEYILPHVCGAVEITSRITTKCMLKSLLHKQTFKILSNTDIITGSVDQLPSSGVWTSTESDIIMSESTIWMEWGVSNHQPHECLLNRLFRHRSKKTSKLRVTGLCVGNSPGTGEFPAQMASYAENVSIWWRYHVMDKYQKYRSGV